MEPFYKGGEYFNFEGFGEICEILLIILMLNLHIDGGGEGNGKAEKILGEELPALAKEVARVETVRIYAG